MECLEGEGGHVAFQKILEKIRAESLEVQTVVSLLRLYQDSNPAVKTALSDSPLEDKAAMPPKGRKESPVLPSDQALRLASVGAGDWAQW